jgi:SAM-dependent methyltransferase
MVPLLSSFFRSIGRFESWGRQIAIRFLDRRALNDYLKSDRRPWRYGYSVYRNKYLAEIIRDPSVLKAFLKAHSLPQSFGFRLDARVVEIPWVLAHIHQQKGKVLDAGSSLNQGFLLTAPPLQGKKITIVTLGPESTCFLKFGVSYVFGDLRSLDFRDNCFDIVTCISTIEHVGMDNSLYVGLNEAARRGNPRDFLLAVYELRRVLKPGGVLYITFPFGEYKDHGWFQQFDSDLLEELIAGFQPSHFNEAFFRYEPDGWKLSDRASCKHCKFFDVRDSKYFNSKRPIEYPPDYPAGERAVACLELFK